ncbi:MAG: presenilin family intramembrane aspartyl protease [Candidatus Aenigmatarchaeota archaeon]
MVDKEIILVSLFFLSVMFFSMYLGILTKEAILRGEIEPLFPSPKDYKNVVLIISIVLFSTILVILLIRTRIFVLKIIENLAAFLLTTTTFSFFLPAFVSFLFSFILIAISEIRKSYLLKNIIIFLSISSASALIGSSLSFEVVLVLFFLLSIYDILSVFLTKHMVYMAENLVENPSTFISVFPSSKIRKVSFRGKIKKIKVIALGSGDYFLPGLSVVSSLEKGIGVSMLLSILNTVVIFLVFFFVSKRKKGKPLPALPFLFLPTLLVYLSLI